MKIRVLRKKPGERPKMITIENELSAFQREVDGHIETVTCASDAVIICNEEGRLRGLKPNCTIIGVSFVGTILLAGTDGEDFTDLPDEDFWKCLIWSKMPNSKAERN